jgi:hypothetical protein
MPPSAPFRREVTSSFRIIDLPIETAAPGQRFLVKLAATDFGLMSGGSLHVFLVIQRLTALVRHR